MRDLANGCTMSLKPKRLRVSIMLDTTQNLAFLHAAPGMFGHHSGSHTSCVPNITIADIAAAARRIKPYVKLTPTLIDTYLSKRFNANVYLKHETLQQTVAFKVRGAFNKMLSSEHLGRDVVAVSAGNHAQAVAYAANVLGVRALILMPENTSENYLAKTRGYGAQIRLFPKMQDAFAAAKEYERQGANFIHPFDDVDVVAGQGTIGMEIMDAVPNVTDVIVSIGGGGLAGGVACAIRTLRPEVRVWGVETFGAHSMAASLKVGKVVELAEITSAARTLGAPKVGQLNFDLARKYLESVTVVSDDEAFTEMYCILDNAKVLTELATSCTLAAAERLKANFGPESHVVLVLCGGNIGLDELFDHRKNGI